MLGTVVGGSGRGVVRCRRMVVGRGRGRSMVSIAGVMSRGSLARHRVMVGIAAHQKIVAALDHRCDGRVGVDDGRSRHDSSMNSSFSSCGTAGAGVSAGPTGVLGDVVSPSTPAAAAAAGAVPLTLGWVELTGGIPAVGGSDGLAKAEMIGTLGDSLSGSWTGAANPGMSSGVAALYDGPYPWASSDGLAW
uniref:Uncharacterized protein n=1 Tax=Anopheles merus TaxID=30066 RepID=A0A182VNB2_ANOME